MKVALLEHTPNPETVIAVAAHQCVSDDDAESFIRKLQGKHPKHSNKIVRAALSKGHTSILEHVSFTFAISGVSRSLTHQLVRHKIGISYSQQSQRYVKFSESLPVVIPPSILNNKRMLAQFKEILSRVEIFYNQALREDIPAEDARYLLPNATETAIIVTVNGRELLHFFTVRCCEQAQWEIRAMAWEMLKLVYPLLRIAFENAGPACFRGPCPEGDRCCGGSKHVRL